MSDAKPLTARQRRAVDALCDPASDSLAAVAVAVRIAPATLHRWRKLPAFRNAVAEAVADTRADVLRRLQLAASKAVETLRAGMDGQATHAMLRAAETTLKHVFGEVLTVDATSAVGSYVIECPPKEDSLEAWRRRWSPHGAPYNGPGDAPEHDAGPFTTH